MNSVWATSHARGQPQNSRVVHSRKRWALFSLAVCSNLSPVHVKARQAMFPLPTCIKVLCVRRWHSQMLFSLAVCGKLSLVHMQVGQALFSLTMCNTTLAFCTQWWDRCCSLYPSTPLTLFTQRQDGHCSLYWCATQPKHSALNGKTDAVLFTRVQQL